MTTESAFRDSPGLLRFLGPRPCPDWVSLPLPPEYLGRSHPSPGRLCNTAKPGAGSDGDAGSDSRQLNSVADSRAPPAVRTVNATVRRLRCGCYGYEGVKWRRGGRSSEAEPSTRAAQHKRE